MGAQGGRHVVPGRPNNAQGPTPRKAARFPRGKSHFHRQSGSALKDNRSVAAALEAWRLTNPENEATAIVTFQGKVHVGGISQAAV